MGGLMPETYRTGAIGDKRKLLGFFAEKGHQNLVLRIADVLDLRNDHQDLLIAIINWVLEPEPRIREMASGWRKRGLLRVFPGGHIVLPFEELLPKLHMVSIRDLQQVCQEYQQVRMGKGEPSRIDICGKCEGRGALGGKKCKDCDGEGRTVTFLEMSDEERQLAVGGVARVTR